MDSLFKKAKELYPNASDEEITQGIAQIRQNAPDLSDDEIVQAAVKIKGMQDDGSWGKAMVRENLKQKYNLAQYSPEEREKLVGEVASAGNPLAAAFAGFGAGIRGGDVGSAFNTAMEVSQRAAKEKLAAFDKARQGLKEDFAFDRNIAKAEREDQMLADMKDPNSERSKAAQAMLVQDFGMDPAIAGKLSAAQVEERIPTLKFKLDRQMKEREFSERQKDRALQRETMLSQKEIARQDKLEKEARPSEKQVKELTEFDNALDSIKSIRAQKGQQDTGPISAAQSTVAQFFGMDDAEKSAFKAEVQDQLAQYIKSISGGAVSDQERATLIQNIPKMSDNDETFNKKLDMLEARLERNRQNAIENAQKMGKNVKEFERKPNVQEQKSSGKVKVIKKQYSPSADKTKFIYEDGSEEIVDGRQ